MKDPEKMFEVLDFLEIAEVAQKRISSNDFIESWDRTGKESRSLYARNQRHGGGSKTNETPNDFDFHKRMLADAELAELKSATLKTVNPRERQILSRYLE